MKIFLHQNPALFLLEQYFDFNKSTGIVSNAVDIVTDSIYQYYGVSFSPDNSKLYITPKQKGYILELVKTRVKDIEERNRWQSVLDKFTREEASEAIQKLSK